MRRRAASGSPRAGPIQLLTAAFALANFPAPLPLASLVAMKLKVRNSNQKRLKKVGFRSRSKTASGRKIIKRKRRKSGGYFRVG